MMERALGAEVGILRRLTVTVVHTIPLDCTQVMTPSDERVATMSVLAVDGCSPKRDRFMFSISRPRATTRNSAASNRGPLALNRSAMCGFSIIKNPSTSSASRSASSSSNPAVCSRAVDGVANTCRM